MNVEYAPPVDVPGIDVSGATSGPDTYVDHLCGMVAGKDIQDHLSVHAGTYLIKSVSPLGTPIEYALPWSIIAAEAARYQNLVESVLVNVGSYEASRSRALDLLSSPETQAPNCAIDYIAAASAIGAVSHSAWTTLTSLYKVSLIGNDGSRLYFGIESSSKAGDSGIGEAPLADETFQTALHWSQVLVEMVNLQEALDLLLAVIKSMPSKRRRAIKLLSKS